MEVYCISHVTTATLTYHHERNDERQRMAGGRQGDHERLESMSEEQKRLKGAIRVLAVGTAHKDPKVRHWIL